MTQDERWLARYNEVKDFIESNQRNPSKHNPEERFKYYNWLKHNRKLYAAGEMKEERVKGQEMDEGCTHHPSSLCLLSLSKWP